MITSLNHAVPAGAGFLPSSVDGLADWCERESLRQIQGATASNEQPVAAARAPRFYEGRGILAELDATAGQLR